MLGARNAKGAALATRAGIFLALIMAMIMRCVYCHMHAFGINPLT